MESFIADFLRVSSESVKASLLGVRLGSPHQIQALEGFS